MPCGRGLQACSKDNNKEERERLCLLMINLKEGKFLDSGKEREGKKFHIIQNLEMNDDLWDRVHGLGSELGKSTSR